MKKLLVFTLLTIIVTNISAGYVYLSGTFTSSSEGMTISPYSYSTKSRHVQFIYTKEEIVNAGGLGGMIWGMAFNVNQLTSGNLKNFEIKMAHTAASDVSAHILATFTTVFSRSDFNFSSTGWQNINFDFGFIWNGNDNIVVDICFGLNTSSDQSGSIILYNTNLPNQMRGIGSNFSTVCTVPTSLSVNGKPQVKLFMENIVSCMPALYPKVKALGNSSVNIEWTYLTDQNCASKTIVYVYDNQTNEIISSKQVDFPINYCLLNYLEPSHDYYFILESICNNDTIEVYSEYNHFTTLPQQNLPYYNTFDTDNMDTICLGLTYNNYIGFYENWNMAYIGANQKAAHYYTFDPGNLSIGGYLLTPLINFSGNIKFKCRYSLIYNPSTSGPITVNLISTSGYSITFLKNDDYSGATTVNNKFIEKNIYGYNPSDLFFGIAVRRPYGTHNLHSTDFYVDYIEIRNLYNEAEITSFSLPGQDGVAIIDSENAAIYVNVPPPTDISILVPALTISNYASINPSPSSPQNFNYPVYYTVTAEDTTISKTWTIYVNGNQNINNFSDNNFINIYPNPAKDELMITSDEDIKVKITDINGKIIFEDLSFSKKHKINISTLSKGMYFVILDNYYTKYIKTFIKE